MEHIARRLALDNFVAFAPDAPSPLGGYPGNEQETVAFLSQLDQTKTAKDFIAAASFLKSRPEVRRKINVVGFCCGGDVAPMLSNKLPDLGTAAPFTGTNQQLVPQPKSVPNC
jgi:carboxymethylenebutenolidase